MFAPGARLGGDRSRRLSRPPSFVFASAPGPGPTYHRLPRGDQWQRRVWWRRRRRDHPGLQRHAPARRCRGVIAPGRVRGRDGCSIVISGCPESASIPGASAASARSGCREAARLAEGCCGVHRCKRGALRRERVSEAACGGRRERPAAEWVNAPSARARARERGRLKASGVTGLGRSVMDGRGPLSPLLPGAPIPIVQGDP